MSFIVLTLFFFSIVTPLQSHADELNAGFVQGIWFGTESVFVGDTVRIYVALRNNADHDLTGTVRFNDNEKRVGTSYVSALPGRLIEAWTDWTPTYGEHIIVATLTNTQLHPLGEDPEMVEVISAQAEQTVFIDRDTDKDGIGDREDADDDNDKVSDTDEVATGTDPLVYNAPKQSEQSTTDEESSDEEEEEEESSKTSEENVVNTNKKSGLEKYIENETVHNVLSDVTTKVESTKQSLDAYREKRNAEVPTALSGKQTLTEAEKTLNSTSSLMSATITRSTLEKSPGMLKSLLTAIIAFLSAMYTFVLWALSGMLEHPALIQFGLLLLILIICYTLARKIGGRPRRD